MVIGDDGEPHGVWSDGCESGSSATGVKYGRDESPVPPTIATCTGPGNELFSIQDVKREQVTVGPRGVAAMLNDLGSKAGIDLPSNVSGRVFIFFLFA